MTSTCTCLCATWNNVCLYQYVAIHIDGSTGNEIKFCESYNYSNLFCSVEMYCLYSQISQQLHKVAGIEHCR